MSTSVDFAMPFTPTIAPKPKLAAIANERLGSIDRAGIVERRTTRTAIALERKGIVAVVDVAPTRAAVRAAARPIDPLLCVADERPVRACADGLILRPAACERLPFRPAASR